MVDEPSRFRARHFKAHMEEMERGKREEGDIPIASPGLTISMTIPIVSDVLLGEWGVLAVGQSHPIMV
jgi:hypothetical protein